MPFDHQLIRMDNGVRLATTRMPHMESVAVGLWADAGSRHEHSREHGMAHLVEHMLFKGTPTRSAQTISREIEGLGSSIDGYTMEDHTAYHAKAPAAKFEQLFDTLSDLYLRPVMDPTDLEIEKQIIHEEIAMVRDVPSQWLEDLISEATWGSQHPLGRSITGTSTTLEAFQRDDVLQFYRRAYSGANTVISIAGNIDPNEVAGLVRSKFGSLAEGSPLAFAAAPDPQPEHRFEEEDDQEQTHLALSFEGVTRHDPSRYAVKLLSVILGENMSSRLFQELREEKALCYEVQSDCVSFDDAGLVQIYLALSPQNLEEALVSISQIASDLVRNGVSASELEEAKSFLVGQSRISLENTAAQMMWAGECLLFFDELRESEEAHRRILETTLEEVHKAAQHLFDPMAFSSALVGPGESDALLRQWRKTCA
ncbi:MAG: pitrilysin family protein [Verrucomicrobiota bacterium]